MQRWTSPTTAAGCARHTQCLALTRCLPCSGAACALTNPPLLPRPQVGGDGGHGQRHVALHQPGTVRPGAPAGAHLRGARGQGGQAGERVRTLAAHACLAPVRRLSGGTRCLPSHVPPCLLPWAGLRGSRCSMPGSMLLPVELVVRRTPECGARPPPVLTCSCDEQEHVR